MVDNNYNQDRISEWKKEIQNGIIKSVQDIDEGLKEPLLHYPMAGGKCTRPILLYYLTESMGHSYESVFDLGIGIEMIHIATLIGDDHPVMDNDKKRRGVKSLHNKYDDQTSLLASNIMQSRGKTVIYRQAETFEQYEYITNILDNLMKELNIGQFYDTRYNDDKSITESEYLDLVRSKTAQIYSATGELATLFVKSDISSNKTDNLMKKAGEFGEYLGISHQMFDDAMDFDSDTDNKDKFSDLRTKTNTIVTIHARNNNVPVFDDDIPLKDRAKMVEDVGSIDYGYNKAQQYMDMAFDSLTDLPIKDEKIIDGLKGYMRALSNY